MSSVEWIDERTWDVVDYRRELFHLRGVLDAARVLAKRANASGAWSVINELTMILDNANAGDGK